MNSHEESCLFGNIECPTWHCMEKLRQGLVVDHLRNFHGSQEKVLGTSGRANWVLKKRRNRDRVPRWNSKIIWFDNRTFFLNASVINQNWTFWVTILGNKQLAEMYEVKIVIPRNGDIGVTPAGIWITSKVHSTDVKKEDLVQDHEGILEFSIDMAFKFSNVDAEGYQRIDVSYQILRK